MTCSLCWVRASLNFSFQIVSMIPAAIQVSALSRSKIIPFFSIPFFIAKSNFQLLFKHSPIICTNDHLSSILVVIEDGPISVPKQHPYHIILPTEFKLSNFFVLGDDIFSLHEIKFHCKFIMVNQRFIPGKIHNIQSSLSPWYCCYVFHICPFAFISNLLCKAPCKSFWYPRSSWVLERVGTQLMWKFSAAYVTVIGLSCWTIELTSSKLSNVLEVVGRLTWSSLSMLVLAIRKLSTYWHTFQWM